MVVPFTDSAALARGDLTPYALRSRFSARCPDVYLPKGSTVTAITRARAAGLWSGGRGILAGDERQDSGGIAPIAAHSRRVLAVEYDGHHHRRDRRQFNKDIRRTEAVHELGWVRIRVTADATEGEILRRGLHQHR